MKTIITTFLLGATAIAFVGCQTATNTTTNTTVNTRSANTTVAGSNANSMGNMNGMNHNSMTMDSNHNMSVMQHDEMKSSPNAANAPYDLQFLDTMIMHHQGAVEMARMVESRTTRAELRAFANKIIADQNKEIARMKEFREKWFAGKPAAMNMDMAGMRDSMKMDMPRLTNSKDKNFDVAFVEMMIPHHRGAITMSKDLLAKGEHDELKTLAENIIKEQEAEIKQMEVWKSEWSK